MLAISNGDTWFISVTVTLIVVFALGLLLMDMIRGRR